LSRSSKPTTKHLPKDLRILHEDRDMLVVDKPPGLLTMGTDKEKANTAYFMLTDYVRKGYAKSNKRLFIVHRLDRDASGILVFAKTAQAKQSLQGRWSEGTKKYLTVVHGHLNKPSDTIASYLTENKAHRVYSTPNQKEGKLSRTAYQVLKETEDLSLLEIYLLTGRKHQIRVHLADRGHPIVGDKKYGDGKPLHKRLALHAFSLSFPHPFSGNPCEFETPMPSYFKSLVGNGAREPVVDIQNPTNR
jgi:RluA family pseudouridine synthase